MNILLAVDGSAYTKKMLAYLATHDELLGGNHQYTVLTVQAPLPARARAHECLRCAIARAPLRRPFDQERLVGHATRRFAWPMRPARSDWSQSDRASTRQSWWLWSRRPRRCSATRRCRARSST